MRTRIAPSPTGALHLGNGRTFLLTWIWARDGGASLPLRVEDLDGPRVKAGAVDEALADLAWLGLDHDGEPLFQSTRTAAYGSALDALRERGLVYPCVCTRREIEEARSAPHESPGGGPYPGTCRGRFADEDAARATTGRDPAWRFRVPEGRAVTFEDGLRGTVTETPSETHGDFVVAKKTGEAAYQLAVVVDDAFQGISDVIRGDDLVSSTPLQILLYEALGFAVPRFHHLPLVRGTDGRRLAKRHGDTRLAHYREQGVAPERVVGLLAAWSGLGERRARSAATLLDGEFAWHRVPAGDIVFTAADDRWLRDA